MLEIVGYLALIFLSISIVIGLYRVVRGPSMPDRVIALDTIGINLISAVAVISITLDTGAFLEVILLLGILSFITTVAFSKFLERGVVIERKRDR